ncbi:MAG: DNA polymerase I [Armatimonadia bacterium]
MSSKLVLIDGNSLVHRAFHALPPLSSSTGQPTGAVYGFVQMVLPLLESEKPERVLVAFDPPGKTFRHEMDEQYKAHRPEMADELGAQMGLAREMADALGLARLEMPGYEADDVIGTMALRAQEQGQEVLIVSSDRDMVQLIRPGIRVLASIKGMKDTKLYDEEAVREQYGIGPEQIPDMKALSGDASDNIPGIAGIGPVGAAKLLQEFGSLQGIYDGLEGVKQESLRRKLTDGKELAMLGRQLARIDTKVPVELTLEQLKWPGPRAMEARRLFARLEFGNLLERTGHWGADWQGTIHMAESEDLVALCDRARQVGHLTLAPLLGPKGRTGLALTAAPEEVWVWLMPEGDPDGGVRAPALQHGSGGVRAAMQTSPSPALQSRHGKKASAPTASLFDEEEPELPECLAAVLGDAAVAKWGSRLKEAARLLLRFGVTLRGYAFDAEVADYLVAPQRPDHSIMLTAAGELGWWVPDKDVDLPGDLPVWQVRPAVEAMAVERLRDVVLGQLGQLELLDIFENVEMPLAAVLAEMEARGIAVDVAQLQELGETLTTQIEALVDEVYTLAGCEFNLDSPKQVGEVLFGNLCLAKGKKTKTGWSTSAAVLEELAEENVVVAKILEYRELSKLRSTYVDALLRELDPISKRIHTTFEQTVAATGRLSSRGPNLQNIPIKTETGRLIRGCFVAPPGKLLVKADYSQIELRLLAHFCGDENLVTAFREAEDVHRRTASMIYGCLPENVTSDMRRVAKTVNFAVLYGMGSLALSKSLGISRNEAQQFIDQYFAALSSVKEFMDGTVARAKAEGYVSTILGRRRPMPDLQSPDRQVAAYAERAAANTPLQGSAADIVKVAMVRLANLLPERFPEAGMLLQVHDELVLEAPEAQAQAVAGLVREVMENVVELNVPLTVEVAIGHNWRDVEDVGK